MAKEKNPWLICLKHIVLASLADFGVFVASSALLAAIFEGEDKQALRNLVAYVFMMVFYAIFFYRFREYNRISTYMEHTERFDPKGGADGVSAHRWKDRTGHLWHCRYRHGDILLYIPQPNAQPRCYGVFVRLGAI